MAVNQAQGFAPFEFGLNASAIDDDGAFCNVTLPRGAIPYLVGAMEELIWPDVWRGEDSEIVAAMKYFTRVIDELSTCRSFEGPEAEVIKQYIKRGGANQNGECSMGFCGVNPDNYKIEDGALHVRDICTGEWVEIGEFQAKNDSLPPEDVPDIPDGFDEPTPCSKVTVWTDVLFGVVDQMLDDAGSAQLTSAHIFNLKNRYPHIDFGHADIMLGYTAAFVLVTGGVASETEDPTVQQRIKCRLVEQVSGGKQGISKAEYDDMQSALSAYLNSEFSVAKWPLTSSAMVQIYVTAARAIGAGDTEKMTAHAIPTGSEDCSCPETPQQAQSDIWFTGVYAQPTGGNNLNAIDHVVLSDNGRRIMVQATIGAGDFQSFRDADFYLAGAEANDQIKIRIYDEGGAQGVPSKDWLTSGPPHPPANWIELGFGGGTTVDSSAISTNYKEVLSAANGTVDAVRIEDARNCPQSSAPENTYRFYMEIVQINGVDLPPIGP